ncbi:MAG: DUF6624 domain-containing protein [Acidobacteriota bacterium]
MSLPTPPVSPRFPRWGWIAVLTLMPLAAVHPTMAEEPATAEAPAADEVPAEANDAAAPTLEEALATFDAEVRSLRSTFLKEHGDPEDPDWVKRKLAHMVEVDQYMRTYSRLPHEHGYDDAQQEAFREVFMTRWSLIDAQHTETLKMLLSIHGWFTIGKFGEQADKDGWLLVQHADLDPDFQRRVLGMLEKLLPSGETRKRSYAYLYDRVAVADNRPQRFGTQGRCVSKGTWEPREMEEPERIDAIRAEVDLGPMAEYIERFVDICP